MQWGQSLLPLPNFKNRRMCLLPEDATVTFQRGGEEVDMHTFHDLFACHVNYSAMAAVTEMTMPGFNIFGMLLE